MRAASLILIAALILPATTHAVGPEVAESAGPNRFVSGMTTGAVGAFDVLILRPLGLVAMAVGAGAYVPAVFLTSPMGKDGLEAATEIFILEPTKSVFQRPLGDF
jgi:hypothetical protein